MARLRAKAARGEPIIGGGAGTGISAKCEAAAGIDLIVIYNSGRFRMAGHGSLAGMMPYGDANAIVVDMAREVLPVVRDTPVLAGVCGTDPMRLMDRFFSRFATLGFAGVQNFPTVGLIDGVFRQNLEETGMGYDREVEMIRLAHELDLLTTPYVFNPTEAAADGRGRRRHTGRAHGPDDIGLDRRENGQDARTMRAEIGAIVEAATASARRRARALPRRADRRAGRCGIRPYPVPADPRLLRGQLDGAIADRASDQGAN